jgi:hypothetical protein
MAKLWRSNQPRGNARDVINHEVHQAKLLALDVVQGSTGLLPIRQIQLNIVSGAVPGSVQKSISPRPIHKIQQAERRLFSGAVHSRKMRVLTKLDNLIPK